MSRIGRQPIPVPAGVQVSIDEGTNRVTVKGPKGELTRELNPEMQIRQEDGTLVVARPSESKPHKAQHGLTRTLLSNMVTGVTTGFKKTIELNGVGYRAQMLSGNRLLLQVGFSHPVEVVPPPGVAITGLETFTPTTANGWLSARFSVEGISKEQVGQLAADIRAVKKAEPYKGKGFRYQGEVIRRKAGKARKAGGKGGKK